MSNKITIFVFAGREENMRIQMPYLHDILARYTDAEVHLWDLTRKASDAAYIRSVTTDRIKVMDILHPGHPIRCDYPGYPRRPRGWRPCECLIHKPPYEQPYRYYAEHGEPGDIYVKIDDDVLFLETNEFWQLIDPLRQHPERVVSAAVVNNAVCAKYLPNAMAVANHFVTGSPEFPGNDQRWWALHMSGAFAQYMHDWFLDEWTTQMGPLRVVPSYVRTRPGEAVSINCIAFTQDTMVRLVPMMTGEGARLGDEGAVDRLLPWIAQGFHAAHLTFGPQEIDMTPAAIDKIRRRYDDLRRVYL